MDLLFSFVSDSKDEKGENSRKWSKLRISFVALFMLFIRRTEKGKKSPLFFPIRFPWCCNDWLFFYFATQKWKVTVIESYGYCTSNIQIRWKPYMDYKNAYIYLNETVMIITDTRAPTFFMLFVFYSVGVYNSSFAFGEYWCMKGYRKKWNKTGNDMMRCYVVGIRTNIYFYRGSITMCNQILFIVDCLSASLFFCWLNQGVW